VPAAASVPLVRITTQPVPLLLGSVKGPLKDAPACNTISSPGSAASIAACRFPPALTVMVRPVMAGIVVFT
jgi:hypothetical protein